LLLTENDWFAAESFELHKIKAFTMENNSIITFNARMILKSIICTSPAQNSSLEELKISVREI